MLASSHPEPMDINIKEQVYNLCKKWVLGDHLPISWYMFDESVNSWLQILPHEFIL